MIEDLLAWQKSLYLLSDNFHGCVAPLAGSSWANYAKDIYSAISEGSGADFIAFCLDFPGPPGSSEDMSVRSIAELHFSDLFEFENGLYMGRFILKNYSSGISLCIDYADFSMIVTSSAESLFKITGKSQKDHVIDLKEYALSTDLDSEERRFYEGVCDYYEN